MCLKNPRGWVVKRKKKKLRMPLELERWYINHLFAVRYKLHFLYWDSCHLIDELILFYFRELIPSSVEMRRCFFWEATPAVWRFSVIFHLNYIRMVTSLLKCEKPNQRSGCLQCLIGRIFYLPVCSAVLSLHMLRDH